MATFPASPKPTWVFTESNNFNTHIINYGNKIEQRIAINSLNQKKFKLRWRSLSAANKNTIQSFFVARLGAYESFTWVNPLDSASYTVRFMQDSMSTEYFNYLLWEINEVEFLEVIE